MTSTPSTPLAQASASSLEELFSRDPEKLSKEDLGAIVAKLRQDRHLWAQAEAQGAKRAPKAKAEPKVADLDEIDL